MPKALRWSLIGVGSIPALVVLVLFLLWLYLQTGFGLRHAAELVSDMLSDAEEQITIGGIEHFGLWRVVVSDVRVSDADGTWVSVDHGTLDWHWGDVLDLSFRPESIAAGTVHLTRLPESENGGGSDPITLPLLPARHVTVERLELKPAVLGQEVVASIEGHELTTSENTVDFSFELRRLDAIAGNVTAQATYRRAEETLALVVEIAEQADGLAGQLLEQPDMPAYSIRLAGDGPRTAWLGKLGVLLDGQPISDGEVKLALGDTAHLDFEGTVRPAPMFGADVNAMLGAAAPVALALGWDLADRFEIAQARLEGEKATLSVQQTTLDLAAETVAGRLVLDTTELSALPGLEDSGVSGSGQIAFDIDSPLDQPSGELSLRLASGAASSIAAETVSAQGRIETLLPLDDPKPEVRLWLEGRLEGLAGLPASVTPAVGAAADWSFDARYLMAEDSIVFDAFDMRGAHARLSGHGTMPQAPAPALATVDLYVDDLSTLEPLLGLPLAGELQANADIEVDLESGAIASTVAADAHAFSLRDELFDTVLGPSPKLAGRVRIEPEGPIQFEGLQLDARIGTLQGDGRYANAEEAIDAALKLDVPSLAALSDLLGVPSAGSATIEADLTGALDQLQARGTLVARNVKAGDAAIERLSASYGVTDLLGLPRGKLNAKLRAIGVDADLSTEIALLEDDRLKLSRLRIGAPNATAAGEFVVALDSNLVDGTAKADITELRGWARLAGLDLAGAASLRATLGAAGGTQSVALELDGDSLVVAPEDGSTYRIRTLAAEARIEDAYGDPRGNAELRLDGTETAGLSLADFRLSGAGSLSDWEVTASASGALDRPVELTLAAAGSIRDDGYAVRLDTLDGRYGELPIELVGPATFRLSSTAASVDRLDLTAGTGKLTMDGGYDGERVDAEAQARGFPLELARVFLPDFAFAGTAQMDARIAGVPTDPTASATLEVTDLRSTLPDAPSGQLRVTGELAAGRLNAGLNLGGLADEPIEASFQMPMSLSLSPFALTFDENDRIQGRAQGEIDLALLVPLLPLDEDTVKGRMKVDGTLAGTLANPDLQGHAVLADGYYESFMTAAVLQDIRIEITATSEQILIGPISAKGGNGGTVDGGGRIDFTRSDATPVQLNVAFNELWVAQLDGISAQATGQLGVNGSFSDLTLGGKIRVDQADIRIPDQLPASVVTIDVTEINKPGEQPTDASAVEPSGGTTENGADTPMGLDLTLDVPGRVFVRGRGLESEWAGNLTIQGNVDDPVIFGALNVVRGDFDLLGKRFNLVRGNITLDEDDPLEPEVDILAEASTTGITAQMRIEGRLKQPELSLSSQPELPPDEVLSRVLFEKGVGELSALEAVQLAQGAALLAGRGGTGGITDTLRRTVGFDTLSVGAAGDGGASVSAGKYLTDDVLLKVEQGTQPGSSRVGVEIEVTPNITVESSTSATGGSEVGANWKWDY